MSKNRQSIRIKMAKRIGICSLFVLILFLGIYSSKGHTKEKLTSNINQVAQHDNGIKESKNIKSRDNIPENFLSSKGKLHVPASNDIRRFPYPYSAMLSLCSDIDDTTLENFKIYHQFLNTKEKTPYGEGVGLDVGDSMWLYVANAYLKPTKQVSGSDAIMSYYKGINISNKNNADEITNFTKCGWIDCIHTFGDFSTNDEKGTSFTRELAINGWQTLKDIGFSPKIWINHGNRSNKQNFGAATTSTFMSYQQGDNPKSIYYHTDITIANGIKYIWNSINNDSFGQDYPLFEITLRDGKKIWGFHRYTNNILKGKIDWTWTPKEIHKQLTQKNLDNIVKNKQYSIVAQHFGIYTKDMFLEQNIQALKLLKQYQDDKKILITRTTRLLDYAEAYKYIVYNKVIENGVTYINITDIDDPLFGKIIPKIDDLRGITFYTDDAENTVILINGIRIDKEQIQTNEKDETGKVSVSIKWFESDYKDYSKQL